MLMHLRFVGCVICFTSIAACVSTADASTPQGPYSFQVHISFSEKAITKLQKLGERIIVSADYFGEPAPTAEKHENEIGQITLGDEEVEVAAKEGSATISGTRVMQKRLSWIKGPVRLNVNVFSARHSGPNNILSCDFFDGNLSDARAHPMAIYCALIEEHRQTLHKY